MNVVQGDRLSEDARSSHRGGTVSYVRLLEGEANTLENFSLVLARTPGRFSPRHRHNFEQFRFQLEGDANYGPTGVLKPGMLGYFPEGVHYGPQTQEEGETIAVLVLQCGGASGSGYPGRAATMKAQLELMELGTFKDGVFHRKEGLPGKKNLDSFQAICEHITGRPLVYPKPRYDVPILMHPDNATEVPVEGAAGVFEKRLGAFTEYRSEASMVRIEAGAQYRPTGKRDIFFALSGKGAIENEPLRRYTTLFLDRGESANIRADEEVEFLKLRLPDLRPLIAAHNAPREAAE